jgi:fatty-acyl-CoA synthase
MIRNLVSKAAVEGRGAIACYRAGLIGISGPTKLASAGLGMARYGAVGGLVALAAARHGTRDALVDELGTLSFQDLHERSNALANGWRKEGLKPGDSVAILARNHRGFLDATFASAKCGARIVLLNTAFAGPQIREVVLREGVSLLVHDDEYAGMLDGIEVPLGHWTAWSESPGDDTLESLIARSPRSNPPRPGEVTKIVILTSGTTGTPKGANRSEPRSLAALGGLFDKVPYRGREVMECCAPMFHALGFAQAMLAVALGDTLVVRRHFDPNAVLESLEKNRVTTVVAVPVMMQRILELGADALDARDTSSVRIIFVAGSQLGADLAIRLRAAFGPVVYNLYGSTEIAYATIATPEELAAEPGCVGTPVRGTKIRILGDDGRELPTGQVGRIFVANGIQFEGYTGGGHKESVDSLMSSGDVGHFDWAGRLFIDGRDDDMIVCGGENVFPGEIEELLAGHTDIVEASAIGVPDDKFGQRLRVFVVRRDVSLDEEGVRDYVRANLARFKVPREVVFLDELPRNPTGKVLKKELAAHL